MKHFTIVLFSDNFVNIAATTRIDLLVTTISFVKIIRGRQISRIRKKYFERVGSPTDVPSSGKIKGPVYLISKSRMLQT